MSKKKYKPSMLEVVVAKTLSSWWTTAVLVVLGIYLMYTL